MNFFFLHVLSKDQMAMLEKWRNSDADHHSLEQTEKVFLQFAVPKMKFLLEKKLYHKPDDRCAMKREFKKVILC